MPFRDSWRWQSSDRSAVCFRTLVCPGCLQTATEVRRDLVAGFFETDWRLSFSIPLLILATLEFLPGGGTNGGILPS